MSSHEVLPDGYYGVETFHSEDGSQAIIWGPFNGSTTVNQAIDWLHRYPVSEKTIDLQGIPAHELDGYLKAAMHADALADLIAVHNPMHVHAASPGYVYYRWPQHAYCVRCGAEIENDPQVGADGFVVHPECLYPTEVAA